MTRNMRVVSALDRISALPDEVLCHILSFVPTKMAVRTSVLSTRWRCLHTMVSSLEFVLDTSGYGYDDRRQHKRFMNSIDRVLLLSTRPSVNRFRLKSRRHIDTMRMETWICALMSQNIQELDVCHPDNVGRVDALELPTSLFFCKTLVALKLDNTIKWYSLKIPANALLPNLKVLRIRISTDSCSSVERLFSICPVLDDLVLDCCFRTIHTRSLKFNISIATLKSLTISSVLNQEQDLSGYIFNEDQVFDEVLLNQDQDLDGVLLNQDQTPQMVINCPAVENLNLGLTEKYFVVLVAAESLVKAVISTIPQRPHYIFNGMMNMPPNIFNAHDILRGMMNIQSLQIEDYIIQSLYNQNLPLPLFSNLTCLKICHHECLLSSRCLEYLLAQCVVLETLVFEQDSMVHFVARPPRMQFYLLLQSRLTALLCHLKTIEIKLSTIMDYEALMMFIEFFLINAKVLEKLSVRVRDFPHTQQQKIMNELSTLPRISKKCQVIVDQLINEEMLGGGQKFKLGPYRLFFG